MGRFMVEVLTFEISSWWTGSSQQVMNNPHFLPFLYTHFSVATVFWSSFASGLSPMPRQGHLSVNASLNLG